MLLVKGQELSAPAHGQRREASGAGRAATPEASPSYDSARSDEASPDGIASWLSCRSKTEAQDVALQDKGLSWHTASSVGSTMDGEASESVISGVASTPLNSFIQERAAIEPAACPSETSAEEAFEGRPALATPESWTSASSAPAAEEGSPALAAAESWTSASSTRVAEEGSPAPAALESWTSASGAPAAAEGGPVLAAGESWASTSSAAVVEAGEERSASPADSSWASARGAPAAEVQRPRWLKEADVTSMPDLASISRTLGADLVPMPSAASREPAPWRTGESWEVYEKLGARDPSRSYLALWLNVGNVSMLTVSAVADLERYELGVAQDCLERRLRLILRLVKAKVPLPSLKSPARAEYIGPFWGDGASCRRSRGPGGVDVTCLQVDLFSRWAIKMMMKKVGFQIGTVLDISVVDWPGQAVLTSYRLEVTPEFRQQAVA